MAGEIWQDAAHSIASFRKLLFEICAFVVDKLYGFGGAK